MFCWIGWPMAMRQITYLRSTVLLVFAACCSWSYSGRAEELLTDETARQYVLMLCDAFDKNRAACQRFTCRYTLVCGNAECSDSWWNKDSWTGELSAVHGVAEGLFVKDGRTFRCSIYPKDHYGDLPAAKNGTATGPTPSGLPDAWALCFPPENMVADDQYVFSDDSIGPQAIISRVAEWRGAFTILRTPWNPIFMNEHAYLDLVRRWITEYNYAFKVRRNVTLGGDKVTLVYLGEPDTGRLEYYVDEARGYLPRKVVDIDSKDTNPREVKALYTDVSYFKGYGWFPMKWTSVRGPYRDGKNTCFVDQLQVVELTMGRPKPELLQVKIPKGRHLIDQSLNRSLRDLVIEKDTVITVKDIPTLLDRYYNPSKYVESARRGPRPLLWPRVVLVVLGAIAVLGSAYIGYRRWRSARE